MVRKNILIMLLSVISVILMVSTSVGAAVISRISISETKAEEKTDSAPIVTSDSGSIGLDETAQISAGLDTKTEENTPNVDDTEDVKPEVPSDDSVGSITDVIDVYTEVPDEDVPSEPSDELIWLAVAGDEVGEDGSETQNNSPNGSGGENNDLGTIVSGSQASPTIEVDEVFMATSDGLVDKVVSIETTLPLNIMGYAKVEILSGNENLIDGPYFDGPDIFDEISLVALSTLIMFLVRAIQILDIVFPIADAIIISTTICAWMIQKILYMIENGFNWITIDITIAGFTISNPIRSALEKLINPILEKIVTFLVPIASASALDIVNYFQNLKTLFQQTDFRDLIQDLYTNAHLAVYAILQVLQNKDTTSLTLWLEQFVNHNTAQFLASLINSYDSLFVSIRDNIFGKFDAFMTYGRVATALRNVHVEVNQDSQVEEGQYVAVIQIKAISAGQVFDTKTIGILYDGSGENTPSAGENLGIASGSTTMGSTTTQSTTNV